MRARAMIERCVVCDLCDCRHGDALQRHVIALLRAGQITPGHALGRMMLDDANLAGMVEWRRETPDDAPEGTPIEVMPWIPEPVPRWRVAIGRALARGELPDLTQVIEAVLARYIPGPAAVARAGIQRDLTEALSFVDPNIVGVEVKFEHDIVDPEHLIIHVESKSPALPGMATITDPSVELPDDIMQRPRGQA